MDIRIEEKNDIVTIDETVLQTLYPRLAYRMGLSKALAIVNGTTLYGQPLETIDILDLNLHLIYQANLFLHRQMNEPQGDYPTDQDVEKVVVQKLIEGEIERQSKRFITEDYPLLTREEIEAQVQEIFRHRRTIQYRNQIRDAVHETCFVDDSQDLSVKRQGMHR